MRQTALIGVDWGLSRLRAMRINRSGDVLELRHAEDGILTGQGPYEERLAGHLRGWIEDGANVPILMSGMIGSDRGWMSVPYVPAPAGVADLARALQSVSRSRPIHIVPGVSQRVPHADVMRGEETEIAGFIAQEGPSEALLCLPGTHSKWVQIRGGQIVEFRTHMTGELRALLLSHSTLSPDIAQSSNPHVFRAALGAREPLGHVLFRSRAQRVLKELDPRHTAEYITGALVGAEVRSEHAQAPASKIVYLLASAGLAESYTRAFDEEHWVFLLVDTAQLAARGLTAVARAAGLLQ